MTIKDYKRMSYSYKKGLRREYKLRYTDEYSYNFKIKCLLIVGLLLSLLSLLYALRFNKAYGLILLGLFGLYSIYMICLVFKSNKHFEHFLNNLNRNKKE